MTTTKAPPRLVLLANELARAKRDESAAKGKRIEAEGAIIALLGFEKAEGQESYEGETPGGSTAKVVLKQGVNTAFDGSRWPTLRLKLPEAARKAVKTDYKIDTAAARAVQETDRVSWAAISELVTRKPGKVSVEIKSLAVEAEDDLAGMPEDGDDGIGKPSVAQVYDAVGIDEQVDTPEVE